MAALPGGLPFAALCRRRLTGDRQLANPFARRCEDRIGERRHHARGSRLADPAGRLVALHQIDVDLRRLVDAQHSVVAEVGLLDAAVLDGDLAIERGRKAEYDAALHLRANGVWIDLDSTIDGAPDVGRIYG